MKKSICIEKIFLEYDFYARFAKVAEAGFQYVEFGYWPGRDISRIKAECDKHGLTVTTFSADFKASLIVPEDRAEFVDYVAKSIEVAKKLNCKNLVIHSQAMDDTGKFTHDGSGLDEVVKLYSAALTAQDAAKLAEKAGVTLVLEAVNNISKPGYYMTTSNFTGNLCKVVGSPNLKILYDISHMQQMEGNMVTNLRKYGDVLGYIHVGDCPERHEPGTGEINFDKIKHVVCDELGLDIVWGFELDPEISSADCVEKLKAF